MYDHHTRGMATTRHRSLVGRGGRKALVRDKAHTYKHTHKKSQTTNNPNPKKRF
jgi:hypothetical protein